MPPKKLTAMLDLNTPLSICKTLHILPAPFNGQGILACDSGKRRTGPLVCSGSGAAGRRALNSTCRLPWARGR
jgi:hypothetical protein